MKVVCSKESLVEGIGIAQKAVSSKTTLPILEGILLEAGENFKLTANDLEMGIECFVDADIRQPGSIVINARMFGDIVKRLPDAEVMLEVKENNVVIIECENSHFEIKGMSQTGYPALPEIKKENAFRISQKTIRDMIRQTLFAVGVDEYRPILTGSLLEYDSKEVTLVSIDGYRVAVRRNPIEGGAAGFNVVIPGKTLNEIVKILQPVDDEMTIYHSQNQILFDTGNYKVVSRLLEGEFLNYKYVMPQDYETKIKVNTKDLLSSIERASLITRQENRYPVRINIGEDKIVISSNTDIGAVREELYVKTEGSRMEIGFNPRYLIEALKAIDEEQINVFYASNPGPCTIRPVEGNSFAYMVLPLRS